VIAAVGLHPSRVPELTDAAIERELEIAGERVSHADVVGEIGLDHKDARDPRQRMRQRAVLERMLALAQSARRPVNLHTRRADRELMDLAVGFTRRTGLPAVMHWFTHSEALARACGDAGVFISVGPSILLDPRQAAVARAVHAGFLLVETDAPVIYAGETARPAWAARVARHLAEVRGIPFEEMAATLQRNMRRYLDPTAV